MGWRQHEFDMLAFIMRWPVEKGGLPRYEHFRNIQKVLLPDIEWNPWLEDQIRSLCENRWVGWSGAASSGKTFGASLYATIWWLCAPDISSVILTSTTKGMIRKRMWANIQKFHTSMPGERFGNFKDSITTWQAKKGDDKHAIFAIAVADGQTSKAVANIQGVHTRRQLLIIDEATDTPEAAFDACANLYSGPQDFQLLVIGNPASHFDPMGKFCEPMNGWKSVNVDTDEWETKPQLDGNPGLVVRFDAEKSPNFKLGETKYTYLVTRSQLVNARRKYGEASPLYWKFYRGFWCPDGTKTTVLNETLISQMEGNGRHIFIGRRIRISSLDPAFGGGDMAIQTFATLGDIEGGKMGFQFDEQIPLAIDSTKPKDLHYQLAAQFIDNCKARNVAPNCAGILAAGEGGGLVAIVAREWSHSIIVIEEGARPSELPVSNEDETPCSERYERKNVELWFTCRTLLESGQLKGLLPEMSKEFCQREFDASKRKIRLQTKKEMKEALGFSPDHADSAGAAVDVARLHGLIPAMLGQTAKRHEVVDRNVKESQEIYDEQNLYQPETAEDLEELAV